MRIGIVSDVHCNATALRAALDAMGDVDEVFCPGDLVFQYRFSNEVMDIVRERAIHHVLGNHEAIVLSKAGERVRASGQCDPAHLARLQSTPEILELSIGGKRLYMVHGSPWEPLSEYLYPNHPKIGKLAEIDADYVLLGHTHFSLVEQAGRVTVINPGSAGDPRDHRNGHQPTYAILDLASGECQIRTFDPKAAAADAAA